MHEFSLCQGLIQALRAQEPLAQRSLLGIEVTIGPLSGVEPELLRHAYPLVVQNTEFAQVRLSLNQSSIQVQCLDCKQRSSAQVNDLRCRHCHSIHTMLTAGNECALTHLYYGEHDHV
ncbi:MAG: hydrogenase maturation nickel metallochaperone HypA [Reinekea sp.]|jgi:hydrogenase nickel incorporation protein HypA/HybF